MADYPPYSKRLWLIGFVVLLGVIAVWWRAAESSRERTRAEQARVLSVPVSVKPYGPRTFDGQPLRVLPAHRPAAERTALSKQPSDVEIAGSRIFSRRLVPVELVAKTDRARADENAQFAEFLGRAATLSGDELAQAARFFLQAHPNSRWATVLRLEAAAQSFRRGYFVEAKEEWGRLWVQLEARRDPESMGLADEVLGRLLETSIGRSDAARLKELIAHSENRPHHGALEGTLFRARQAVWLTEHTGAQNVRCGPLALHAIKDFKGERYSPVRLGKVSAGYIATGLPLTELARYAEDNYHLPSKMARRTDAAAPLALPAVMHLQGDHYAALLAEENGRYYLDDRSLGFQGWVDREAIERMSSGNFLLASNTLPPGYAELTAAEGQNIFGRDGAHGTTPTDESETDDGPEEGDDDCKGMARYAFNPALASVHLMDMPVGYVPPVGPPVACRLVHKQLDTSQPTTAPGYAHVGKVWNIDWIAYVEHVSGTLFNGSVLRVHPRGGGTEIVSYSTTTAQFGPDDMSFVSVKRTGTATYTREFPDGSKEVYDAPDSPTNPGKVFLTRVIDPSGNAVALSYDSMLRLVGIADAIGQITTLQYNHPTDPWLITSVTDPFSRVASLAYDASGRLISITDVIGLVSSFTYGAGDRVATLTTPYGTTQFAYAGGYPTRTLQITDPQGDIEKVEFADPGPVIPSLNPPPRFVNVGGQTIPFYAENERLEYRNSYYWSKIAWAAAPGDYKAARNYRWYTGSGNWLTSPIMEAVKEPLEDRVWFNYPGSAEDAGSGLPGYPGMGGRPEKTMRVLSDGTAQLVQTFYNPLGNPTKLVDPLGRMTEYVFASNGVDLLEALQTTGGIAERLAAFTYNTQHLPLTAVDAAGQTTTFTYNSRGQVLTVTNPKNEVTTFGYNANGYLGSIDGPLSGPADTVVITYDAYGRTRAITDVDGYAVILDYDLLDRPKRATYPDGTFEEQTYDKLHRIAQRDRLGRVVTFTYNAIEQVTSVTDPLNRVVRYDWCKCGDLRSMTDPLGRLTRWRHDLQGRVLRKEGADGSAARFEYETATSRLSKRIDEKNQTTIFDYFPDNRLRTVSYPDAQIATPSVSFTYDPHYPRVKTMTDGQGLSTYNYHAVSAGTLGAGQLASVDGPWGNDLVAYNYDQLGRKLSQTIDGSSQSIVYDAIGRISQLTNSLGTFAFSFAGTTPRPASVSYPNGQSTHYDYFSNLGDRRLQRLRHLKPDASPLATHEYSYDAVGQILTWSQTDAVGNGENYAYSYDLAGQLSSAVQSIGVTVVNSSFEYDDAANRSAEVTNGVRKEFSFNALNQLVQVNGAIPDTTYEWDGENRLRTVIRGLQRSEYEYDGLGRRVGITEKNGGAIEAAHRYLWCDLEMSEERDSTGDSVEQRFFGVGRQVLGGANPPGNYFHTVDHLGSLREVTNAAGAVVQRATYDPWGRVTFSNPAFAARIGFTGHFQQPFTGLMLAPYRAYSPELGRWISRDPISEAGGFNLYAYVFNDPANLTDPTGELAWFAAPLIGFLVGGGIDLAAQLIQNGGNFDCVSWGNVIGAGAAGAVLSSLGPSGVVFGRAGSTAARMGYRGGALNTGNFRVGWSWNRGRNWFSVHGGKPRTPGHWHRDLFPGPSGPAVGEFGVGGGVVGGAGGAAAGSGDCCK